MRAPTSEPRIQGDLRTLEAALPVILEGLGRVFSPSNTWLCGACGCLCKRGEVCPKCRGDLVPDLVVPLRA